MKKLFYDFFFKYEIFVEKIRESTKRKFAKRAWPEDLLVMKV